MVTLKNWSKQQLDILNSHKVVSIREGKFFSDKYLGLLAMKYPVFGDTDVFWDKLCNGTTTEDFNYVISVMNGLLEFEKIRTISEMCDV